jgi:Late competence development protein ComFB
MSFNIRNFQELLVSECVMKLAEKFPDISGDAGRLEDVACIALNSLRPRYVRDLGALQHHMSDDQRDTFEREANSAVLAAFEFVLFKA